METTFITIHDLSEDALILYSSDSIVDILGHTPDEVVGRSTWDFFLPGEVPAARNFHSRGVQLDKAAVLAYCSIQNRRREWVTCECCFTIVYDVMVCCTSIYRAGLASQNRATDAPVVRRIFSSSPKDPRYHMLTHLSSKFRKDIPATVHGDLGEHEPRAALFLNRFTRTLTIMHATSGIEKIVGIPSDQMKGRSFYFCIQENCLEDAVRCLESAKGNDSIAYLRFWYRDPRQDDQHDANYSASEADTDEEMTDASIYGESEDATPAPEFPEGGDRSSSRDASGSKSAGSSGSGSTSSRILGAGSESSNSPPNSHRPSNSHMTSAVTTPGEHRLEPIELEAVVSCTSDGLVVCLRRAQPYRPDAAQPQPRDPIHSRGIFAAPWASDPVFVPALQSRTAYPYGAAAPDGYHYLGQAGPSTAKVDPAERAFMDSIRDQAVFAWALTGINGSLEEYARGKPKGESQPPEGFPVWSPDPGSNGKDHDHSTGDGSSGYGSGSGNGHDAAKG